MNNHSLDVSLLANAVKNGQAFSGSTLELVLRDLARARRCRAAHANSLAEDEFVGNTQENQQSSEELH